MWLQTADEQMEYTLEKLPRVENPSDILTHCDYAMAMARFFNVCAQVPWVCITTEPKRQRRSAVKHCRNMPEHMVIDTRPQRWCSSPVAVATV